MSDQPITRTELQAERALNVYDLVQKMADLHLVIHSELMRRRQISRDSASHGTLPNVDVSDYVLVARSAIFAGEKLALHWRGPRRIVNADSDYIYTVEDLHNCARDDVHISKLKFHRDADLKKEASISHLLAS